MFSFCLDFCDDGFEWFLIIHNCTSDVWKPYYCGKKSKAISTSQNALVLDITVTLTTSHFFYFGPGIGPPHVLTRNRILIPSIAENTMNLC